MNLVTACAECNGRKAARTPEEARMPLLYLPYVPSRFEDFLLAGRNDWAAPEPVTGTFCICFVSSEEEHSPVQRDVAGSSPARGASFLDVAEWLKVPGCKPGGVCPRWFESSRRVHCTVRLGVAVAQWQSRGL